MLKAKAVYDIIGLPVIGDDSGLEVVALNNQPGVYSSRFAGDNASDDDNIDKLLRKMHNIPTEKRTARFRCVVAFLGTSSDDQPVFFEGEWAGYIAKERRGKNGFGYDPVFVDLQSNLTAAELESDQKNKISHRGKAMQSLKSYLRWKLKTLPKHTLTHRYFNKPLILKWNVLQSSGKKYRKLPTDATRMENLL